MFMSGECCILHSTNVNFRTHFYGMLYLIFMAWNRHMYLNVYLHIFLCYFAMISSDVEMKGTKSFKLSKKFKYITAYNPHISTLYFLLRRCIPICVSKNAFVILIAKIFQLLLAGFTHSINIKWADKQFVWAA